MALRETGASLLKTDPFRGRRIGFRRLRTAFGGNQTANGPGIVLSAQPVGFEE